MSAKPFGGVLENAELTGYLTGILSEIKALAAADGVKLPEDVAENALKTGRSLPYETKTSYQRDLEVPGKPNEGELFGGTIIALGKKFGVPTPVTAKVFAEIQKAAPERGRPVRSGDLAHE